MNNIIEIIAMVLGFGFAIALIPIVLWMLWGVYEMMIEDIKDEIEIRRRRKMDDE